VAGLARQQPVLLLLEDAHWIDPTTEELLGQAIERLRDTRVLILVTSRPEYCASWGNPTNLTRLPLSRLGHRHCTALIDSVSMGKTLPELVVAEIVRKTDGIPLFVEELTKTVIESGLLSRTEAGFKLEGSLSALAIPSTLQDSLMARLDRLVHAKEVAQVGATIGREFTRGLLASALPIAPERLTEALDELVKSELVFRRGTLSEATYTFKHALVRDTAYTSMVKSQRTHLHSQIAQAIEQHEPKKVATQPELLAYHHQEAGHLVTAIGYWIKAGDRACPEHPQGEGCNNLFLGPERCIQ
jgi:predicted ATPase